MVFATRYPCQCKPESLPGTRTFVQPYPASRKIVLKFCLNTPSVSGGEECKCTGWSPVARVRQNENEWLLTTLLYRMGTYVRAFYFTALDWNWRKCGDRRNHQQQHQGLITSSLTHLQKRTWEAPCLYLNCPRVFALLDRAPEREKTILPGKWRGEVPCYKIFASRRNLNLPHLKYREVNSRQRTVYTQSGIKTILKLAGLECGGGAFFLSDKPAVIPKRHA